MNSKIKTVGIIFLSMLSMMLLFVGIVGIGNYFHGIDRKVVGNIFMFLFPLATYVAVILFNAKVNGLSMKNCGFGFKKFLQNSLLGLGLCVVLIVFFLLMATLFSGIEVQFSGLNDNFHKPLLGLLSTLIIVGFWEEFYFRGLVFNTLVKNNFGFHSAALISSILFSIIHWSSFDMNETSWLWYIGIVEIAYILVYMYSYTNSIWYVVFFHFLWNAFAQLVDDSQNEIGLIAIKNYTAQSKILDDIMVACLGVILILLWIRKVEGSKKIKSYLNQLIFAPTPK